ncbi:MAG: pyridoxal phosphate-dependent aminotransferase [Acidimicrobiales bacterium]|nr:pyridoxal phosphate-dependent aminotransferase [Acidimicrobiales bacterium]
MSTGRLSVRVGSIAPSATLAITAKAKELKAQGKPVIGFGAGEPDFPTPDYIVEAAVAACRDPKNHKYTPAGGLAELKVAIAEKTRRDSGLQVEPAQVVVTNGGKHAVYNAIAAVVDSGDEVLIPTPFWTTYPEPVKLAGGVPVTVETSILSGFKASVADLEAARTPRTKALIFVSPSNPSGAVYDRDEIVAIGEWAAENDIWVLTDEIYEHLVYDDNKFFSMPALVPEIAERCIVLNGVAKTYAMTGWRVGWVVAPIDVAKALTSLQSHQTSNVNNVAQIAALAAVSGDLSAVHEMREHFDRRRLAMHAKLDGIVGVECLKPQGAFYAFPNFEGVMGQQIGGQKIETTLDLAAVALDQANVAFVPGEAFGSPGYARFSYALGDDDLGEGLDRIVNLING